MITHARRPYFELHYSAGVCRRRVVFKRRKMASFLRTLRKLASPSLSSRHLKPPSTATRNAVSHAPHLSISDNNFFARQTSSVTRMLSSSAPLAKSYRFRHRRWRTRTVPFSVGKASAARSDYAAVELALNSVVKVFSVLCSPNYLLPWQNKSQRETMGSGQCSLRFLHLLAHYLKS